MAYSGRQSLVETANGAVSILTVCREIGMAVPDIQMGRSIKTYCPFGRVFHGDGGVSPAFRIYPPPDNSCFCFAGCGLFTPVWLFAQARDLSTGVAAKALLDLVEYRPGTEPDRTDEISGLVGESIDRFALAEALKMYCSRIDSGWAEEQFSPRVAATLVRCFEVLAVVSDGDEARRWLAKSKVVMAQAVAAAAVAGGVSSGISS